MSSIFNSAEILKVARSAIGFYPVFMVNLHSHWTRTDKSNRYESVDSTRLLSSKISEHYACVPIGIGIQASIFFLPMFWNDAKHQYKRA